MSDYPRNFVVPTHITSLGRWSLGKLGARLNVFGSFSEAGVWTGQTNAAMYIPFMLEWPYNVRRMFWGNGSIASGNADVGIYTLGGARLWSAGSTAVAGASTPQYVTPSPNMLLHPGVPYFMAHSRSTAVSSNFLGAGIGNVTVSHGRHLGILLQLSAAHPLPLQATFAAFSVGLTVPFIGFTNTDSGF